MAADYHIGLHACEIQTRKFDCQGFLHRVPILAYAVLDG